MNYKMVKAEDGVVWVTLQPLMHDVKSALENAKKINVENMDSNDKRGVDFTILSMESVYNFLGSLLTEHNVSELVNKDVKPDNEVLH